MSNEYRNLDRMPAMRWTETHRTPSGPSSATKTDPAIPSPQPANPIREKADVPPSQRFAAQFQFAAMALPHCETDLSKAIVLRLALVIRWADLSLTLKEWQIASALSTHAREVRAVVVLLVRAGLLLREADAEDGAPRYRVLLPGRATGVAA